MKIVLRNDVDGLGKRGDVLDVADGYARNYLMPQGFAMRANAGTEREAAQMRQARELREAQSRAAAEEIASRIVSFPLTLAARAGDGGRLFGSITTADVVLAAKEQVGIELDKRWLSLDDPIKELGSHIVTAKPHTDVEFPVTVNVVADEG